MHTALRTSPFSSMLIRDTGDVWKNKIHYFFEIHEIISLKIPLGIYNKICGCPLCPLGSLCAPIYAL
jgi:hypothetical protein